MVSSYLKIEGTPKVGYVVSNTSKVEYIMRFRSVWYRTLWIRVKSNKKIHRASGNHWVMYHYHMGLRVIAWTKGINYSRNFYSARVLYH